MEDKHWNAIDEFIMTDLGEPSILQEAVGLLSTELAHAEDKLQLIAGVIATSIDEYEKVAEVAANAPIVGSVILED